jgi:glycosyltransferase involved in cell wall biosynthesis
VNALFYRDGRVCEDCVGKLVPFDGIRHACYRGSHTASAVVAAMLTYHKLRGTYRDVVHVHITLSAFAKRKFVEIGLDPDRIVVKPNFVDPDPGPGEGTGGYALFVGRLSQEKGVSTLLAAWEQIGTSLPLLVVGDGPLGDEVRRASERSVGVRALGRQDSAAVRDLMGDAKVLVFPSLVYETFGRVAVEAFARGTPVVASNIGAIAELVEHGRTGLQFAPGDARDLVRQVEWILAHPDHVAQMRLAARSEFEKKYVADRNYAILMEAYERAKRQRLAV